MYLLSYANNNHLFLLKEQHHLAMLRHHISTVVRFRDFTLASQLV